MGENNVPLNENPVKRVWNGICTFFEMAGGLLVLFVIVGSIAGHPLAQGILLFSLFAYTVRFYWFGGK